MTAYEMVGPILGIVIMGLGIYMIATADKQQESREKESSNQPVPKPDFKIRGIITIVIGILLFIIGLMQALI